MGGPGGVSSGLREEEDEGEGKALGLETKDLGQEHTWKF
jgi:hypothetical protein